MTAETSGILIGGWQTDREHAYVAVSRAREQTQIYLSREDLGEQGMDLGAVERLGERMARSRAQEASIAKQAQREASAPDLDLHSVPSRRRSNDGLDDMLLKDGSAEPANERLERDAHERIAQHQQEAKTAPVNINKANAGDIHLNVQDRGNIQLAYSTQLYDLQDHTGEPTYILFGGWQTEEQLGFVTAIDSHGDTHVHMSTENRDGRNIQTELTDRIAQVIERSQSQQASHTHEPDTPQSDREHQQEHPTQLEPGEPAPSADRDRDQGIERDQHVEPDNDRSNDLSFDIE